MNQMSGMMGRLSDITRNIPAGSAPEISESMGQMSNQMREKSDALSRGTISWSGMRALHQGMSRMQVMMSSIERK